MTYNTTGRRIRTENLADPATVTLSYDAMGRQTRAVDAAGVTTLAYPNGLTASWAYGSRGELLEIDNALPSGSVSKYAYTYDAAGRRITCARSGTAFTTPDTYAYLYNARSELTNATAMVDTAYSYGYQFDDIGNRETASERGTNSVYEANNLNQYTSVNDFVLQFDADGNQTRVKTATGTWQVAYNGENRPVRWERIGQSEQSTNLSSVALAKEDRTILSMSYDRMGRRVTKNDQRFVYNGYLQIADNTGNAYVWDPTEPIATRPLVWRHDGETFFYVHDGNKNVSEVIASDGTLAAHYEYAPFGMLMLARGPYAAVNPCRFSSEYHDEVLCLEGYVFRHFNTNDGRWINRDWCGEMNGGSLFSDILYEQLWDEHEWLNPFKCSNNFIDSFDVLGLVTMSKAVKKRKLLKVTPFDAINTDTGALQRLVAAEVMLPGQWKRFNVNRLTAEKSVNALLWCLCNRKRMRRLNDWTEVVKEKDGKKVQWKDFSDYPTSYSKSSVRSNLVDFQMHAEKGLNNVKGFRVYYDFWEYIRTKAAEVDCGTQKSGFEGTESFKRNYREGCSVCYMRTEKSGLPVNGAIKLGTLANNTFYISNGN